MSKKNSNVILKNSFKDYKEISLIYSNFRKKQNHFKKKSFLIAVSGGPDSLALTALAKSTDNTLDDKAVSVIKNGLFPGGETSK